MTNRKSNRVGSCLTAWLLLLASCLPMTACDKDANQPGENVQVLQGEKGDPGEKGEKGDPGDPGEPGAPGEQGVPGIPGNGIVSVEKTATDGLTDTYTITYTDGTTSTFTLTNGQDGEKGEAGADGAKGEKGDPGTPGEKGDQGDPGEPGNGIVSIEKTATDGLTDTYTITFADGSTSNFALTNGQDGEKGEPGAPGETGEKGEKGDTGATGTGISSVQKTGTVGLVDTYTITFTDGRKTTFTVTNGKNGTDGKDGQDGQDGEKGETGETGRSAYEAYCQLYGYTGTEEQWLADLVAGKLIQYTVTFNLNGGKAGSGYESQVKVTAGSSPKLTVPTRTGYTFLGWYTGEGVNDGQVTTTTPVCEDMTLIARWQINTLTVTFQGYDGKTLSTQTVKYGQAAVAPEAPQVTKMRFSAWDTDFSKVTKNLTVKAVYVADTYTVTYDTDGGTALPAQTYYMGDTPRQSTVPVKSGYYFVGWYRDSAHKKAYNFDKPLNADTTLYAYFSEMIPLSTPEDLLKIKSNPSAKYCLTNDIDMDGNPWTGSCAFSGVLDGQGYKIHNFTMTGTGTNVGFFTTNSGTVKSLTLQDFTFSVEQAVAYSAGAIAGTNSGSITGCHVVDAALSYNLKVSQSSGEVSSYSGGICGTNNGFLSSCSVQGHFTCLNNTCNSYSYGSGYSTVGINVTGGIIGRNNKTAERCNSSITATFDDNGTTYSRNNSAHAYADFGGAVGHNYGTVTDTGAEAYITLTASGTSGSARIARVGGFCSTNQETGVISGCFAKGNIAEENNGFTCVSYGGFVFMSKKGSVIKNSYANVNIKTLSSVSAQTGARAAGFVGENLSVINNCYCTGNIETAITGHVAGFVGTNYSSGAISKCFSTGKITLTGGAASATGYFCGGTEGGQILNKCYYLNTVTIKQGSSTVQPTNKSGEAKAMADLQSETFLLETLNWPSDTWVIRSGNYPCLSWES